MNKTELKDYEERVNKYKLALKNVYNDGYVNNEEQILLNMLKNELGLSTDECRSFEQPYLLTKKAVDEDKKLHFNDICDCHNMHLCIPGNGGLLWESIDNSTVEYIEINDKYIEKCLGGFGSDKPFITLGDSIKDLLEEYGENNFPEQAEKDGRLVMFEDSYLIDDYLMTRFNILTPLEIEEEYTGSIGINGEVLQDYLKQVYNKEFYDIYLNKKELAETSSLLKELFTYNDDSDVMVFKPPFKINQDIQLVEWDEKDRPIIQELDTKTGFYNLLRKTKVYYQDDASRKDEIDKLSYLIQSLEKGVNRDRLLEFKWDELEDIPFITDENGIEILDTENDWWLFEKGTEKDTIWHYFDEEHSKGIDYLVNDYPSDRAIKDYIFKNFTEDTAHYIYDSILPNLIDSGVDVEVLGFKFIAQKTMEELDEYFNSLDDPEQIKHAQEYFETVYDEVANVASTGRNNYLNKDFAEDIPFEEPKNYEIGQWASINLAPLFEKRSGKKNIENSDIKLLNSELFGLTDNSDDTYFIKYENADNTFYYDLFKNGKCVAMDGESVIVAEHKDGKYKLIAENADIVENEDVSFELSEEDFELVTGKVSLSQLKQESIKNNIYEWLCNTHYKKETFDFDIVQSKHDVCTIAAIDFIYEMSKTDLSYYDDASTFSQAIAKSMLENDMIVYAEDTGEMEPISSFARELLHNNSLQFAVRDFAAAISELDENRKIGLLNDSKDLIERFCINEYDSTPTFENLKDIGLAFTTWEDPLTHEEYEIQASVDLLNCTFKTTLNDVVVDFEAYENLEQMNSVLLSNLDFDSLVYMGDKIVDKALYQEHEDYKKLLCDKAEEILNESFEDEIIINDAALYIPSDYGFDVDNKLHILLQINSDKREDSLFNVLNETPFTLPNGIEVDFNPITLKEHGTIGEYLEHLQEMYEKERYLKSHPETKSEKENQSQTPEQIINSFTEKLRESNNGYDTIPVFNVLIKARDVLKSFSDNEKKVIGKWLMDSGVTSENTMKEKLENVINPKEKEKNQKREIKRSREEPLHSR